MFRFVPSCMFLLVMMVGVLLVPATFEAFRAAHGEPLVNGTWARTFQRELDARSMFRDPALALWGAIRYRLLREGRGGVLVGDDGFLFTTEEYAVADGFEATLRSNYARVLSVRDRLEADEIDLVIALLPAKARVYSEVAPHPLPEPAMERYNRFRSLLTDAGVAAPDLAAAMGAAKAEGAVFMKTDTHWTPFGSQVVARAIRELLAAHGELSEMPVTSFRREALDPVAVVGDLIPFLGLGSLAEDAGPGVETVAQHEAVASGGNGLGLFDTPEIPIALVGTSYSADPRWRFADNLKLALSTDVLAVAQTGEGPFVPMDAYLSSETIREIPPRLVIWEIPERYVTLELIDQAGSP